MIDIESILKNKFPQMSISKGWFSRSLLYLLKKVLREQQINQFIEQNSGAEGVDFIDKIFAKFNIGYTLSSQDRLKIPESGALLIVANHPIGSMDGLALMRLISEVRPDVKVVVNDLLTYIEPLRPMMLPVDNMGNNTSRQDLKKLYRALKNDETLIFFPAGEVSRMNPTGVRDSKWNSGFLKLAQRFNAPVLPVHIGTRNSWLFYFLSTLNKNFGTLLLVREMFNKQNTVFPIKIGDIYGGDLIGKKDEKKELKASEIRSSVYRLNKRASNKKTNINNSPNTIYALPESRKQLKKELLESQKMGQTRDGKLIYLYDYFENSAVMREIGRLREVTFRTVGEGSGRCRDLDTYDRYYRHIVLWDDNDLEIVGSYRIGECKAMVTKEGLESLYVDSLFELNDTFLPYIEQGIELGRSFVQPQYWGKRSLDYLWHGIGAYLRQYPEVKYMFGPVSISNDYSEEAKQKLVHFYAGYFEDQDGLAKARNPYPITEKVVPGSDFREDFVALKLGLKQLGYSVPTLYKQYTEVCEHEGVRFIDFNVDADFGNCVDGLILVEVGKLKPASIKRYMNNRLDVA